MDAYIYIVVVVAFCRYLHRCEAGVSVSTALLEKLRELYLSCSFSYFGKSSEGQVQKKSALREAHNAPEEVVSARLC